MTPTCICTRSCVRAHLGPLPVWGGADQARLASKLGISLDTTALRPQPWRAVDKRRPPLLLASAAVNAPSTTSAHSGVKRVCGYDGRGQSYQEGYQGPCTFCGPGTGDQHFLKQPNNQRNPVHLSNHGQAGIPKATCSSTVLCFPFQKGQEESICPLRTRSCRSSVCGTPSPLVSRVSL